MSGDTGGALADQLGDLQVFGALQTGSQGGELFGNAIGLLRFVVRPGLVAPVLRRANQTFHLRDVLHLRLGDLLTHRMSQRGELHFGTADEVRATLRRSVPHPSFVDSHCHLVAGFFEQTVSTFDRPIALLHLDVDLYRSYLTCLEALYPKLSPGGVVLFDEYTDANFPGARRAVDEYFGERVRDLQTDPFLSARFLVKPR